MPDSRKRHKKSGGHVSYQKPHVNSSLLHYAQASERNVNQLCQLFRRGVTQQIGPELADVMTVIWRICDRIGDLGDWLATSPEAAWIARDKADESELLDS